MIENCTDTDEQPESLAGYEIVEEMAAHDGTTEKDQYVDRTLAWLCNGERIVLIRKKPERTEHVKAHERACVWVQQEDDNIWKAGCGAYVQPSEDCDMEPPPPYCQWCGGKLVARPYISSTPEAKP